MSPPLRTVPRRRALWTAPAVAVRLRAPAAAVTVFVFSRRVFSSDIDIPEQKITNDYYHPFFLLFVLVLHNAPNPYNPQLLHQEELRMEFKLLDKYA